MWVDRKEYPISFSIASRVSFNSSEELSKPVRFEKPVSNPIAGCQRLK
jgi:hypothetical protein